LILRCELLAHDWGGRTVWVIQDSLLHNIELTTRLKTLDIPNNSQRNINVVVLGYSMNTEGTTTISLHSAIEGDAGIEFDGSDTFTDILLPKLAPPKVQLLKAILRRKLAAIFRL
jgi:predicted HNH restriction endonuclease